MNSGISQQVPQALKLDRSNFYLLGQSWGGILAIEYALKYQQNLKALIISNMVASIPAYNEYAQKVLMPAMNQKALAEIKRLEAAGQYDDPHYMDLLMLVHWDRTAELGKIAVPTLAIGARYDTMEPAQMERIARSVQKGRYLFCPNGSHLAIYDDQKAYMGGILDFIRDVDTGRFRTAAR